VVAEIGSGASPEFMNGDYANYAASP
jgi:hypothetical protein